MLLLRIFIYFCAFANFHVLGIRKDIDWDKALIEAVAKLHRRENISTYQCQVLINSMLMKLKDLNTCVVFPIVNGDQSEQGLKTGENQETSPILGKSVKDKQESPKAKQVAKPVKQEKPRNNDKTQSVASAVSAGNNKLPYRVQPYVEISKKNVAVVVATDYDQFSNQESLGLLLNAFSSAVSSANILVIDVRCSNEDFQASNAISFMYVFLEAFRLFLKEDLPLPTTRERVFTGHPEHRRGEYPGSLRLSFFVLHLR